jgi:hypothetical protein
MVVAAPLIAPLMYFGDDPQRFHEPKLTTNLLDKPGVYRLFAADPRTPAATVTVRSDLSVRFAADDCMLEGTRDRAATRKVPSGTWPDGRVYQLTTAEGRCASATVSKYLLMRPALRGLKPTQAKAFPMGNGLEIEPFMVAPCCSTQGPVGWVPPISAITRIEVMPPAA